MKKIIFLICCFCLIGCSESETELQKNVINTAYNKCLILIGGSLKSPSSLKIGKVLSVNYVPTKEDAYRIFRNDIIIDSPSGPKLNELMVRMGVRFRAIGFSINYEAQNSFGVNIPGTFSCNYMYTVNKHEKSPDSLRLYQIQSDDKVQDTDITVNNFENESNIYLIDNIGKILNTSIEEGAENDQKILDYFKTRN